MIMIINGEGLVVGRVATIAAKSALMGEKVDIVNCEKMVLTGSREFLISEWLRKRRQGTPRKGPYISRLADRFVRRIIRGMLPHRKARGKAAYNNIMCHLGVPDQFKDQKLEVIEGAKVSKMNHLNYLTVGELLSLLGGKNE